MNADGNHLAPFTSARDARGIRVCGGFVVFLSFEDATVRLLRVNSDGSNPTELVTGALSSFDCSSRGGPIYYFDTRAPAKILRISVEGGTPAEVAKVLHENWSSGLISVSPDGNYLAYNHNDGPTRSVAHFAVVPTSGGPSVKTFEESESDLVRWSPDSKNLDYIDRRSGAYNIWEQPLMGGAPKQLTKFTTDEYIVDFTWSVDGLVCF